MSNTAHVVDGEASESESEEIEVAKSMSSSIMETSQSAEAFVIAGEAPESDDEDKVQAPTLQDLPSTMIVTDLEAPPRRPSRVQHRSLLHQKLWECNVSLRATVEGLLHHSAELAVTRLSHGDRSLLGVQESMRSTNASLTLARARLKQVHAGLEKANCSAALPTVKTR